MQTKVARQRDRDFREVDGAGDAIGDVGAAERQGVAFQSSREQRDAFRVDVAVAGGDGRRRAATGEQDDAGGGVERVVARADGGGGAILEHKAGDTLMHEEQLVIDREDLRGIGTNHLVGGSAGRDRRNGLASECRSERCDGEIRLRPLDAQRHLFELAIVGDGDGTALVFVLVDIGGHRERQILLATRREPFGGLVAGVERAVGDGAFEIELLIGDWHDGPF